MATITGVNKAKLFYSDGSPYARICRIAYREAGLQEIVEEVVTTLRDPSAALLPYSPSGKVPALTVDESLTISETTLILAWFDRHGAKPTLLPQDDQGLSAYGRVLGMLDGIAVWNRELRRPVNERSPGVIATEEIRAERIADALELDVAAGRYDKIDAAYFALSAVLGYVDRRHKIWKWFEKRPNLAAWFAKASQRPAFVETIPATSGI